MLRTSFQIVQCWRGNNWPASLLPFCCCVDQEMMHGSRYSVDTNAANIYVGPILYAAPRDFTLDHSKPYDDMPGLLPVGQAHGQNNYLLGTGNWSYALRISDDSTPENDLVYETVDVPAPPKGQGHFSAFLVPGHIKAKAQLLDQELWGYAQNEYGGRGAPRSECSTGCTTCARCCASDCCSGSATCLALNMPLSRWREQSVTKARPFLITPLSGRACRPNHQCQE